MGELTDKDINVIAVENGTVKAYIDKFKRFCVIYGDMLDFYVKQKGQKIYFNNKGRNLIQNFLDTWE